MNVRLAWLFVLFIGCAQPEPAPWRLLQLGTKPIHSALSEGMWVAAETEEWAWITADSALDDRLLIRDLASVPTLACGDEMVLSPMDLPTSARLALGWEGREDSLRVRWHCFDRRGLSRHFLENMPLDSASAIQQERKWISLLRKQSPEHSSTSTGRFQWGDPIHLEVVTETAAGDTLEPKVLHLDFHFGDGDQVVQALAPGVMKSGPGSHWCVWSTSADAFGSEAHPGLGLPPHMPLRFTVTAR